MRLTCQLWGTCLLGNGRSVWHGIDRRSILRAVQNPKDKSATKRTLEYWIELAKLLERGGINALFLADTTGGHDTYEGKLDECIRRAAQWPVTDPTIVSMSDKS